MKKGIIWYRKCITYQIAGECLANFSFKILSELLCNQASQLRLGECSVVERCQFVSIQTLKKPVQVGTFNIVHPCSSYA